MSAPAAPLPSDRSDFRTVTLGGAGIGLVTGVITVGIFMWAASD